MSDLIKKSDAIKAVEDGMCTFYDCYVLDRISAIPSADRPQGWIPCSERLPKKEKATYLICTEDGYMCSCRWTNNMYGLRSNEWSKWGWHVMDKPQYAKVVAWMPWEPWKGASNGEDIQSADE